MRLQGQYHDPELALYYNRHRYYDPHTGAFISGDPLGLAAGTNLYAYAPNAWRWIDPLGLRGEANSGVTKNPTTQSMISIYGLHSKPMHHNDPISNWEKNNLTLALFNKRVNTAQRLSNGIIDLSGINDWQSSLYTAGLIVGVSDGVLLSYVAPELYFYALSNPYTLNEIGIGIMDAFGGTAPETALGQAIALGAKAEEYAGNKIK